MMVADRVMGDEEIPEGVTAVIAPDVTDIVSHIAVRARNANILFASCHDAGIFQRLKSMQGHFIHLNVRPNGDVVITESAAGAPLSPPPASPPIRTSLLENFSEQYSVAAGDFTEQIVGGKSGRLARLRDRLPEWIHLPSSVALPFGVFERVLKCNANKDAARHYNQLIEELQKDGHETLTALRETVLAVKAPAELPATLHDVMNVAGLPWPDDWKKAWHRIK